MKILLICKLPANSLANVVEPIQNLGPDKLEKIFVLRDTEYLSGDKRIINYTIFNFRSRILRNLTKVLLGIYICLRFKVDKIISIQIYPHGYIAYLISLVTGTPFIHIIIAGEREFWVKGKFIEKINLFLFRSAQFCTVTGANTYRYLNNNNYFEAKIITLPNVINIDKFCNSGLKKNYDIISLSRIDKNKNIGTLIKAVNLIRKDLRDIKVLIAGDGPEFPNMRRLSENFNLSSNINFPGWVPVSNISYMLNKAKIFVLCSKGEGFPLTLLEAMACGLVPVVSNAGDISDVVKDDYNGYLLNNFEDEIYLADKLKLLLNDSEKLKLFSERAINIRYTNSFEVAQNIWKDYLLEECHTSRLGIFNKQRYM